MPFRLLRRLRVRLLSLALVGLTVACTPAGEPPGTQTEFPTPAPVGRGTPSEASARPPSCAEPCRQRPRRVGGFPTGEAPEASGLAASRRNAGMLYVLDDGPGTTSLLVIRAKNGRMVGRLEVEGLQGTDTESLAVGRCRPRGAWCIYIGDIGDNLRQRASVTVTRVPEPDLSGADPPVRVAGRTVTLTYPGRPRDAEALLVSTGAELAIVTKAPGRRGRGAARVYLAEGFSDQKLQPAGRLRLPPPRAAMASLLLGNVVTGGDAVPGRVVLRTYDALYEFTAPSADARLRHLPDWTVRQLRAPSEVQGEAVAYATDGCGLFTVSEDSGRLTSLPCR